jgi:hypothetical protein
MYMDCHHIQHRTATFMSGGATFFTAFNFPTAALKGATPMETTLTFI